MAIAVGWLSAWRLDSLSLERRTELRRARDAIDQISGEIMARAVGQAYSRADADAVRQMKEAGKSVVVAQGEFLQQIKQSLSYAESAWIAKAKRKGMANPEAVMADFRADIAARHQALGIPMAGSQ